MSPGKLERYREPMTEQQGRLKAALGWIEVAQLYVGRAQANLELADAAAQERYAAAMRAYSRELSAKRYELRMEQLTLERLARERGEEAPL